MPKQLTTQQFIERSVATHGNRYDYSKTEYRNNMSAARITCPQHGDFTQRAAHHMDGHGCPRCKDAKTSARCRYGTHDFVTKARAIHGDLYDYSLVNYERTSAKVQIICSVHGPFWQVPNAHVSGKRSGCPKCAGKFLSTSEFVEKARAVHGSRFSYDATEYKTIKGQVAITCETHGVFHQMAENHLAGSGCHFCWQEAYISKDERELADWIESAGLQVTRNDRETLPRNAEIDIFIPSLSIGIEYNGCYWHSDKVKGNHAHAFKHAMAQQQGIRIITVWDYDWKTKRPVVERFLSHALGISRSPKISARACAVVEITGLAANAFYEANHIQGACRGSVLNLGLMSDVGLVAAMSFTIGGTRRGISDEGEWELARYATSAVVRGGAGKLFSAFIKTALPTIVWSFSDKQHFAGGIYDAMGFSVDGDVRPDYRLVNPATMQTWHKSLWQRKSIPKRLAELGISESFDPATDERTERQMQDVAKILRVWDSGKTRWVWRGQASME